jgi:fused signal recognition particle receptor
MFRKLLSFFKRKKSVEKIVKKSIFNEELQKSLKSAPQHLLNNIEEALLKTDMGITSAENLLKKINIEKTDNLEIIQGKLRAELENILKDASKEITLDNKPEVILAIGVNGSGKTTSLGKIAYKLSKEKKKTLLVAADTFRAAAANQLKVWAKRANCELISANKEGADAAALCYKAIEKAKAEKLDIVLIDTAGRLQNQQNLMDELSKITRVIKKIDPSYPHRTILVIDGTVGQNALKQLETFNEHAKIDGIIITKLDGTAKGGAIIPIVERFKTPIYYVGIGEKEEELIPFNAKTYISRFF